MSKVEIAECNDYICSVLSESPIDGAQEAFGKNNCLALPSPYNETEYYYAQETIDFIKYCRESTTDISIETLPGKGVEVRSLHSFDIFMPIIWVATTLLLPTVIGVVSNYIYDKMKGREHEDANVELSFIVERDNERKMLHYKGPTNEFNKEFKKIDLTKL